MPTQHQLSLQAPPQCGFTATDISPSSTFPGDFNHASLYTILPYFHQFVDCPTKNNKTLDILYANTADAYSSPPLPPHSHSDHNLVHLLPTDIRMVKIQLLTKKCVKQWSEEASEALQDCFNTTDWNVLCGPHGQDISSFVSWTTTLLAELQLILLAGLQLC